MNVLKRWLDKMKDRKYNEKAKFGYRSVPQLSTISYLPMQHIELLENKRIGV